ncbi:MAG: sigma-70 family RNA polymerase sigma factor [Verrucomicrobiaceae bacterium]|nr:MAG: sigma-70 family RNA polymerase sigma factor [Verrucomicrobiaceae bacterium]
MKPSPFHSTRWTLVRRAQGTGTEARAALSELCDIYYEPVLRFTRRWCNGSDQAPDLAHGFFEKLLSQESPGAADPQRGRFRNYLLGSLKHFLCRQREREGAAKRGGGLTRVPLDEHQPFEETWEREFDRAWAIAMIRRALDDLRDEMERSGKALHFETLRPWLDGGPAGDSTEAGRILDLSPTALKVAIHRLRERFRENIRREVAATTDDAADVDAEFSHLVNVWVSCHDQ